MPVKKPVEDTLYVRGIAPFAQDLNEMAIKHRISPQELARGLIEASCQFYREHGWFSFPVVIQPEAFQARYVAEEQAAYNAGKIAAQKGKKT